MVESLIIRNDTSISSQDMADVFPELLPARLAFAESRIRDGLVYLATQEKRNIGFLIYSPWWGNTPFIEYIKVKPDYQRKGIGTQLLKAAIKDIKAKGFDQIVSSTKTHNQLGLQFHAKIGFELLTTLPLLRGEEQFFRLKI